MNFYLDATLSFLLLSTVLVVETLTAVNVSVSWTVFSRAPSRYRVVEWQTKHQCGVGLVWDSPCVCGESLSTDDDEDDVTSWRRPLFGCLAGAVRCSPAQPAKTAADCDSLALADDRTILLTAATWEVIAGNCCRWSWRCRRPTDDKELVGRQGRHPVSPRPSAHHLPIFSISSQRPSTITTESWHSPLTFAPPPAGRTPRTFYIHLYSPWL